MNRQEIKRALAGTYKQKRIGGKLLETHISWLLIGDEFVFKIKKPVKFSFLDFSSLDKRRFYCERELELNRRLSKIYLDVVAVKDYSGQIVFESPGPGGTTIDFALRMNKMEESKRMDLMLAGNQVKVEHLTALAIKLANFHQRAIKIESGAGIEEMQKKFNDILQFLPQAKGFLTNSQISTIEKACAFSDDFLHSNRELFQKRMESGWVRDVHGDLHTANIFLYDDPEVFDCIEFNDAYRQIDILNELAFLCMDMEAFGRSDLSMEFINIYRGIFPCMESRAEKDLFNYFKCYRANVKTKILFLSAGKTNTESEGIELVQKAEKYLRLMEEWGNERINNEEIMNDE